MVANHQQRGSRGHRTSVRGRDYLLHRVSAGDPLRTRCGRLAAKVNVTTDPTPREELCVRCGYVRAEDLRIGGTVVARTDRGLVEGVVDNLDKHPNWQVVLRVNGIPEAISNVAGSEKWTLVGFRLFDIVEVKP